MTVYMKKGDRLPLLRAELTGADGAAINLTAASVVFRLRARGGAIKIAAGAVSIVSAELGVVQYAWSAGDTDTEGVFDGEFIVTIGGLAETVPGSGAVLVLIESGLS